MSLGNVLGTILKTIEDVQQKNQSNPNVETADKDIFSVLKDKLRDIDQKSKQKRASKGKSPESILDIIKREVESVRTSNRNNPNQRTADSSVFDNILKKVEERPRRQASSGLRRIVQDYNLDVSRLPKDVLKQVRQQYISERQKFERSIAQSLNDLINRY